MLRVYVLRVYVLRVYVLRVNVPAGRSSSSVVASILASETNWLHKFLMSPAQSVGGLRAAELVGYSRVTG